MKRLLAAPFILVMGLRCVLGAGMILVGGVRMSRGFATSHFVMYASGAMIAFYSWRMILRLWSLGRVPDPRKPHVLLLRSFRLDNQSLAVPKIVAPDFATLEEDLTKALPRGGQLVKLRHRYRLPDVGAVEIEADDQTWQPTVLKWLETTRAVVVFLDSTESLRWEMEQIGREPSAHPTLLVMPPLKDEMGKIDAAKMLARWAELAQRFADVPLFANLPVEVEKVAALERVPVAVLTGTAAPMEIVSTEKTRVDGGYREAVALAARTLSTRALGDLGKG